MKIARILVLAGVVSALALTAHGKIERTVEKTFSVSPGGKLTVSTQGGNIDVQPADGSQVHVVAKLTFRHADSEKEADEIQQELELEIEQGGDGVQATARMPKKWMSGGWGRGNPVSVSFTVTVPKQYNVELNTSGGNIGVGDLTGAAKVKTSGGNIRVGRFDGEVDAHTSGGNISVVEAVRRVDLRTSGGDIKVERASGDVEVRTSGGNIAIGQATGAVQAQTSGGDIKVAITGPISRDMVLRTSGGNVSAQVSDSASFTLDASTSGGRVNAEGLTIRIEDGGASRTRLRGAVNGGGPTVTLRTSGGNVNVSTM